MPQLLPIITSPTPLLSVAKSSTIQFEPISNLLNGKMSIRALNLTVVFLPRLCINGVTNQRTQRLGLAWPWGIIIQWTNFLSRGFDLIVDSNDINLVYDT